MNIVVICSDTFRYDHLGFVKRQDVFTPNLDCLACESAAFTDFQLCSFPTLVNRIEVFTGRYTFPLMDWGPLPFHFPVLAEVFKHHGFETALVADNPHMMGGGLRFGRGFDFVRDVPGQAHDHFQPSATPMIELNCSPGKLEPRPRRLARYRRNTWWNRQQGTNTTELVFRDAMRWLEPEREKFFLWIDSFDPHEPWNAPEQFLKKYPWDAQGEAVIWPHSGNADHYSAADLANMRSIYKAEVSQTDHWIGQLLEFLRQRKLLEDTAVIFCSDHGYYFGEHNMLGKPLRQKMGRPIAIYDELSTCRSWSAIRGAWPWGKRSPAFASQPFAGHPAGAGGHHRCAMDAGQFPCAPTARRTRQPALCGRRLSPAQGQARLSHSLDRRMVPHLFTGRRTRRFRIV